MNKAFIVPKWGTVPPPKPVPVALITVDSEARGDVNLWISAENSLLPRTRIWPDGWPDRSKTVCFAVRLPSEFLWPPSDENRMLLHLYDSGRLSTTGGRVSEFKVAFGETVVDSAALQSGPVDYDTRSHLTLTVP